MALLDFHDTSLPFPTELWNQTQSRSKLLLQWLIHFIELPSSENIWHWHFGPGGFNKSSQVCIECVHYRQVLQYMTGLLNQNVGFLINERFINIPAQVRVWFELPCTYSPSQTSSTSDQITVPLWETLVTEMRKARDRNLPFDFGENQ